MGSRDSSHSPHLSAHSSSSPSPPQPQQPNTMLLPSLHTSSMINPNSLSMMSSGLQSPFGSMVSPLSGSFHHVDSMQDLGPSGIQSPRRRRGRPRKYSPDGSISLGLEPPVKRARGRPVGSGKKNLAAAGTGLIGHNILVKEGEDILSKIMDIAPEGTYSISIIAASGAISKVNMHPQDVSGDTLNYEGRYDILQLQGCNFVSENNGIRRRTGSFTLSMMGPDGGVIHGIVAGVLEAATPVQIVVGTVASPVKETNAPVSNDGTSSMPPPNRLHLGAPSVSVSGPSQGQLSDSSSESDVSGINRMSGSYGDGSGINRMSGSYGNDSQTTQSMQMYQIYGMGNIYRL